MTLKIRKSKTAEAVLDVILAEMAGCDLEDGCNQCYIPEDDPCFKGESFEVKVGLVESFIDGGRRAMWNLSRM